MLAFPSFDPAFPKHDWVLHRVLEHQARQRADAPFLRWADDGPELSLQAADLIAWCQSRLPAFAVPRYIEFMAGIRKTPSEKVRKGVLRAAGVTATTWDRTRPTVISTQGQP